WSIGAAPTTSDSKPASLPCANGRPTPATCALSRASAHDSTANSSRPSHATKSTADPTASSPEQKNAGQKTTSSSQSHAANSTKYPAGTSIMRLKLVPIGTDPELSAFLVSVRLVFFLE